MQNKILFIFIFIIIISCSSPKESVYDTTCNINYLIDLIYKHDDLTNDDIYKFLHAFENGICNEDNKYNNYRNYVLYQVMMNNNTEAFINQLNKIPELAKRNIIHVLSTDKEKDIVDPSTVITKLKSIQTTSIVKDEVISILESWPLAQKNNHAK